MTQKTDRTRDQVEGPAIVDFVSHKRITSRNSFCRPPKTRPPRKTGPSQNDLFEVAGSQGDWMLKVVRDDAVLEKANIVAFYTKVLNPKSTSLTIEYVTIEKVGPWWCAW